MNLQEYLASKKLLIEEALAAYLPPSDEYPAAIREAMNYSLFAGGKRLRPILTLAAAEVTGGDYQMVLPAACAIEMIHTYSLIHDDLPAMDDDDYRRGKLTNHKVFGEGMAVLAGDALLTYAFEVLARGGEQFPHLTREYLQVVKEIAVGAGISGMIGGQVLDLQSAGRTIDGTILETIHQHKTGALLIASLRAGAILSGAGAEDLALLTRFGRHFGLAFQITDDLLDATGSLAAIGKTPGSDARKKKATYPALYGLEMAQSLAREQVEKAVAAVEPFGPKGWVLQELARYVLSRRA